MGTVKLCEYSLTALMATPPLLMQTCVTWYNSDDSILMTPPCPCHLLAGHQNMSSIKYFMDSHTRQDLQFELDFWRK